MSEVVAIEARQPSSPQMLELAELASALQASGYFADVTKVAQAAVKILAGRELGIGPVEALSELNIVKGRCEPSAEMLARLVKRSGRYDYRVLALDDTHAVIAFVTLDGELLGQSEFTQEDRERAGLSSEVWAKYPRNMLWSRAMSNGVTWFCPDVVGLPSGSGLAEPDRRLDDAVPVSGPERDELAGSELVTEPASVPSDVLRHLEGEPQEAGAQDSPEPDTSGEDLRDLLWAELERRCAEATPARDPMGFVNAANGTSFARGDRGLVSVTELERSIDAFDAERASV